MSKTACRRCGQRRGYNHECVECTGDITNSPVDNDTTKHYSDEIERLRIDKRTSIEYEIGRAHRTLRRLGEQRRATRAAKDDDCECCSLNTGYFWDEMSHWRWLAREAWRWVEYARAELALRDVEHRPEQPTHCGHDHSSIVQAREGTAYCSACEAEARAAADVSEQRDPCPYCDDPGCTYMDHGHGYEGAAGPEQDRRCGTCGHWDGRRRDNGRGVCLHQTSLRSGHEWWFDDWGSECPDWTAKGGG